MSSIKTVNSPSINCAADRDVALFQGAASRREAIGMGKERMGGIESKWTVKPGRRNWGKTGMVDLGRRKQRIA